MRTTIIKKRNNKIRIGFVLLFAVGILLGRMTPKLLNESYWQIIIEMITGTMQSSQTVTESYLVSFSVVFFAEIILLLICFSFAAIPLMLLFFFGCGTGIGAALTAYFTVYQGHGLLFVLLVLGPQMICLVCIYILMSEMGVKASQSIIMGLKKEKSLDYNRNTRYNLAVKILTFTAMLALCSLYYAVMKHFFAPTLPY